jgi:outer membrane protein insertion porin family
MVDVKWYFPLFWKLVLGVKNRMGYLDSWPGITPSPSPYDPFLIGGTNYDGMLRGYRDASLGGLWANSRIFLCNTSEISFPIVQNILYASTFFDIGNLWGEAHDVDFNRMYSATGAGIRVMVPMFGLLGFDMAYGFQTLDPEYIYGGRTHDISPWEFHFQIGRGF